jgi:hypothetical protein
VEWRFCHYATTLMDKLMDHHNFFWRILPWMTLINMTEICLLRKTCCFSLLGRNDKFYENRHTREMQVRNIHVCG